MGKTPTGPLLSPQDLGTIRASYDDTVSSYHRFEMHDRTQSIESVERSGRLPVWRVGIVGGLAGVLCCVGPTVLALIGFVSAGTAFVWATNLYNNDAWWFRLGGLVVTGLLVWVALRRRNQCSVAGIRKLRWRLLAVVGVAVATYGILYGITTWLGTLA